MNECFEPFEIRHEREFEELKLAVLEGNLRLIRELNHVIYCNIFSEYISSRNTDEKEFLVNCLNELACDSRYLANNCKGGRN